eukprot:m.44991 g.44991  ORF g.44991 m.44991 type:complete len:287 (-) comp13064_c0_seq1:97-957(-)
MLRRQQRERREYLYRKSLEDKEKTIHERKQRLRAALQAGKAIPSDLRGDAAELQRQLQYDDANTTQYKDSRDDEYRWAGTQDPKVMVTTSRDPSSRLKQFVKEVKLIVPNSQRLNRGNHVMKELVEVCRTNDVTDLVIVHEHRGEPDGLIVSHLPYGPTAFFQLTNVVMRHDLPNAGTMSEAYPHLIFHGFSTPLGDRATDILKYLFPVPKAESKRVMTFANDSDYISFRHHVYTKKGKEVELAEVGPRFEMKLYQIKLGTADQTDADKEWVAKPYLHTAKKKKYL